MPNDDLMMARTIAEKVRTAGGRTFFVGGLVRDRLQGRENKDIDIEVHGITPEALSHILDTLGERTVMGASFGIYGLRHYRLDIAMPRSEKATGRGHRDFAVWVDPFIGVEKAAMRRDFTVNALMQDVLTDEVIDCFGGLRDLQNHVLRHVSDESFAEDPLRVLRAAQFAARFDFSVAPETKALCSRMDLTALARERVFSEMEKALLKADRPSVFFSVLRSMGQLSHWFPEAEALIGVPQNPAFHPEGDVWEHTLRVLDAAATMREQVQRPGYFMLAALCHDLGKPATTRLVDGRIRAIGHEKAGVTVAESLLDRLTDESNLKRYVLNMIQLHMQPNALAAQQAGPKAYMKLYDRSEAPSDLLLLSKADALGAGCRADAYAETEDILRRRLAEYEMLMTVPQVTGKDLIAAGLKPGPQMGEALALAHRLHLSGIPKEQAIKQVMHAVNQRQDQA